jgi:hypothetical protein
MMAAVFDCMVFLQPATSDRGPALACLELAEQRQIILHGSFAILAEVRHELSRPTIQGRCPHLASRVVDLFLQKFDSIAVLTDRMANGDFRIRDANNLP